MGQSEQERVGGDEGREVTRTLCGALWAMVRTLAFTRTEMELRKGPEQRRDVICHGVTLAACRKQRGSRGGNRKTMEGPTAMD